MATDEINRGRLLPDCGLVSGLEGQPGATPEAWWTPSKDIASEASGAALSQDGGLPGCGLWERAGEVA